MPETYTYQESPKVISNNVRKLQTDKTAPMLRICFDGNAHVVRDELRIELTTYIEEVHDILRTVAIIHSEELVRNPELSLLDVISTKCQQAKESALHLIEKKKNA